MAFKRKVGLVMKIRENGRFWTPASSKYGTLCNFAEKKRIVRNWKTISAKYLYILFGLNRKGSYWPSGKKCRDQNYMLVSHVTELKIANP